jgi:glycerophosphoryl diester phosphodiesterase
MSRLWRGFTTLTIGCLSLIALSVPSTAHASPDGSAGSGEPAAPLSATDTSTASTGTTDSTTVSTTSALPQGRGVGNVAHKGDSVGAPENTLAAVRQAIAERADFVGIDVHRTRDHELVVLHDATLARTTNVEKVFPRRAPWNVGDFTLAQIKRLDAGSWMSRAYTYQQVPTLAETLRALRPSTTGAFLEIKRPDLYGGVRGIGTQVVREIHKYTRWLDADGPAGRLVIQAFDDSFLKRFAARYDEVVIGTLGAASPDKLDAYASWGADQINVHYRDVTAQHVNRAHSLGLEVSTYVVNERRVMRRVVDAGVDAISTDYPGPLREVLQAQSRMMQPDGARAVPAQPVATALTVRTPERARMDERVPVSVALTSADGRRARWTWLRVQRRKDGRWVTLQRQVTDRFGRLRTTVSPHRKLRLRVLSEASEWYTRAEPVVRRVVMERVPAN